MSFLNERGVSEASEAQSTTEGAREVMDFPFLNDSDSIKYITTEIKMLCILSGLSDLQTRILASDFTKTYQDSALCCFSSTQLPNQAQRKDGPCQDQVEHFLKEGAQLVIVNCTSRSPPDLKPIFDLAHKYNYTTLLLQPNMTSAQRGPSEDKSSTLSLLPGPELTYPYFFGWFLGRRISLEAQAAAKNVWGELCQEPEFVKIFEEHALPEAKHTASGKLDFDRYFSLEGLITGSVLLHCTSFYSDYGKQDGSKEYATSPTVHRATGRTFDLTVIGFLATPQTLGARIRLGEEELLLWGFEGEPECTSPSPGPWRPSRFSPTYGRGSRAHLTMGVAEGIEAVQTGLDLRDIISKEVEARREQEKTGKHPLELKLGSGPARYYGEGLWCVYLDKPIKVGALFSGWY